MAQQDAKDNNKKGDARSDSGQFEKTEHADEKNRSSSNEGSDSKNASSKDSDMKDEDLM